MAVGLAALPVHAGPSWPDLYVGLGGTFGASGHPNSGGFETSLTGLWNVDDRLSFGASLYADDIGTRLAQYVETGPPLTVLGTYESDHRFVYGAGWRLDYDLLRSPKGWRPFATAGWQYARVQDDARGDVFHAQSSAAVSLGLGARRNVLKRSTIGLVVRYRRLPDDRVKQYAGATLEWGWRLAKTP